MKKNILVCGIIAGALVAVPMLLMVNYLSHCEGNVNYTNSMLLGYAAMLIALSLVFVGIKNYRDKYNGGLISFGKSFKIGILIVLIASTIYVIAWHIDLYFFIPDFAEKYAAQMLGDLRAGGATEAEIQKQTAEMADFTRMYKNPLFSVMMTYAEILPVGLLVTLISSLILKRKTRKVISTNIP